MEKTKFNLEKEVTKLNTKVLDKLTRDNFKPTKKETALIIGDILRSWKVKRGLGRYPCNE